MSASKIIWIALGLVLAISTAARSQTLLQAEEKFHQASRQYINNDLEGALASVKQGLKYQPKSEKLEALRKILEQEQKQQEEQQKKDQQKKDQQKQDQQNKDQQKQDQQNKENQDKKNQQQKEQEKKDQEKKDQEDKESKDKKEKDKDEQKPEDQEKQDQEKKETPQDMDMKEDPKISEEKARMILEAMKNMERQYLQQNRRKATKPKDRGKPDW